MSRTVPFHTLFEHGLLQMVERSVEKKGTLEPTAWLIMPFDEPLGRDATQFSEVMFTMMLFCDTKPEYTQDERDEISYKQCLLPMSDAFLESLSEHGGFMIQSKETIRGTRRIYPYFGLGAARGADTPNFINKYVDALFMNNIQLKTRFICQ
ncbi:MAG TPA: hypothetical protein VK628_05050 [Flavitalea sp.]|nr:hypothetical protein [Flavitalea sp.]